MKTKFWILIIGLLLLLCIGLSAFLLLPREAATHAEIFSEGTLYGTVDLRVDQQFQITNSSGGTNTLTVQDGKIAVTQATCPDHYCMHRGYCDSGTEIVCLPNKLIIRFVGTQEIDAQAG